MRLVPEGNWRKQRDLPTRLVLLLCLFSYCSHIFSKHCCAQNYVEQIALETKGDSSQMHLPTASPQTFCSTLRVGEGVRGDVSKYFDKISCNFMQFETIIVFLSAIFQGGLLGVQRGLRCSFVVIGCLYIHTKHL